MSAEKRLALLIERRDRIREWLAGEAEQASTEQKHLEPGTPERTYWHHGYQTALDDMLKLLSQ